MLRDFIVRIRRVAIGFAVAAAIGGVPLSACGVKGPLRLPTPPSPAASAPSTDSTEAPTPTAAPAPQPPERKP